MPLMQMHNENNNPFDFSVILIPQTSRTRLPPSPVTERNKYRGLLQLLH